MELMLFKGMLLQTKGLIFVTIHSSVTSQEPCMNTVAMLIMNMHNNDSFPL